MIPTVAGYQGFLSYGKKPYSILKAGQTQLERDYYPNATNDRPCGKTYLANSGRFKSEYVDQNKVK